MTATGPAGQSSIGTQCRDPRGKAMSGGNSARRRNFHVLAAVVVWVVAPEVWGAGRLVGGGGA